MASRETSGRRRDGLPSPIAKIPIVESLIGYSFADFKSDLMAGIVVAALTIPLSMGYAEVAGVPPVYGLYAAMIASVIFAVLTKSRNVVFGMDSATAAVTGGAVAELGVAFGTQQAADAMPILALMTAAFVLGFWLLRLGKLAEKIPAPVMHGFVLGISLVVIIGQIPKMLGMSVPGVSALEKLSGILAGISAGEVSLVVLGLSVAAVLAIAVLEWKFPKVPAAIVVLVAVSCAAFAINAGGGSVPVIGEISSGFPAPALPSPDIFATNSIFDIAGDAFAIALVLSIESMLCFKALAKGDDEAAADDAGEDAPPDEDSPSRPARRPRVSPTDKANRELGMAGIANAVSALFACPPSASSLSRTAAAKASGGKTQVASLVAALIVFLSVSVLSGIIALVPQAVLGAIVTCAMVKLPDFQKLSRYAQHMKIEFAMGMAVAAMVFFFGAMYGVLIGVAASFIVFTTRRRGLRYRQAIFGVVDIDDREEIKELEGRFSAEERKQIASSIKIGFGKELAFSDAAGRMEQAIAILDKVPVEVPLLLGLSKLEIIDASANDALLSLIDNEKKRGRDVYCIRKLALANDSYTRYELRRVFAQTNGVFPSKKSFEWNALRKAAGMKRSKKEGPSWTSIMSAQPVAEEIERKGHFSLPEEQPVVTLFVTSKDDAVKGRLIYVASKETIMFSAEVSGDEANGFEVTHIVMSRRRTNEGLGEYIDGKWRDTPLSKKEQRLIKKTIESATTYPAFLEEFDGIEVEDHIGNEYVF